MRAAGWGWRFCSGGTRYSAARVPTEDEMAEFYETACEFLERAGFRHYEISNWARPGFESRHNLKYWRREPYLGFGAGAHSFSGEQRWANAHDAAAYVAAIGGGKLPVEQLESSDAGVGAGRGVVSGVAEAGWDRCGADRAGVWRCGRAAIRTVDVGGVGGAGRKLVRLAPGKLSVANEVFVELMK